ncbi:MAG: hypothetical protein ACYDB7_11870 [Mycobacteriales bacterium]
MRRWLVALAVLASPLVPAAAQATPAAGPGFCYGATLTSLTAPVPCPLVEPGGAVNLPGFYCTIGFLFRGSDGHLYADTAGHCASTSATRRVTEGAVKFARAERG